jgi:hypothetical protein
VAGGLLPPFGEPAGERVDDAAVLSVFLRDEPALVHSEQFHLEGNVLVVGGDMAAAIRIGPRTFLVRCDLPPGLEAAKASLEEALRAEGMSCLDNETLLAMPVAIQRLGIRLSTWDLWGAQIDESFAELRAAAAGEWDDLFPEGPPPVGGPPL